jgi:hypothetical protein
MTIPLSNLLNNDQTALNTGVLGLRDYADRSANFSLFGDQVGVGRIDSISTQFHYNISSYDVVTEVSGTGATSHGDNKATVSTGTGIGASRIYSKKSISHYPGHESHCIMDAVFSAPDVNTVQKIGCFNGEGFWIGYNGTQFGVAVRNGDVDTFIPQTSWNGNQLLSGDFVLDPTKMNLYKIAYGWGIVPTTFEVSADNGNSWVVMHTEDNRNSIVTPVINNPLLPMAIEVESTSAPASPVTVSTSTWSGGSGITYSGNHASSRFYSLRSLGKNISAGVNTNVITVRNPSTWQGKTNRVSSQLMYLSVAVEGTQPVNLEWRRNVTLGGTPVFTPVSADSSPIEYDVAGATATGGELSWGVSVAKTGNITQNTMEYELVLPPGNDSTLVATSSSSTVVSVYLRARDLF